MKTNHTGTFPYNHKPLHLFLASTSSIKIWSYLQHFSSERKAVLSPENSNKNHKNLPHNTLKLLEPAVHPQNPQTHHTTAASSLIHHLQR